MEKHPRERFGFTSVTLLSLLLVMLFHFSRVDGISFTVRGKFLLGYEIGEKFTADWFECLMSCQKNSECVSYNYHTENDSCQLNSHGFEHGCVAKDVLVTATPYIFHQVKPVKNGRLASQRIPLKCSCNCGVDKQCSKTSIAEIGDTPEQAASSCKEILSQRSNAKNGPYYLKTFGSNLHIYCHMTVLPGCGGGGWTLVIKMDGNEQTFSYNSSLWTAMSPLDETNGVNLGETETMLPTYWSTSFTRLCLGMKYNGNTNWIAVNYTAKTLLSVISPGREIKTDLEVKQWESLLRNSSLQTKCTIQGFNIAQNTSGTASARIGITGFPNDCASRTTSHSRIGFGTGGTFYGMDGTNTCGNEAKNNPDNGERSIKAFGYVLIQ